MTGLDRSITKSLMAYVRGLFQSPPSASGLTAYKVYNERDLEAFNAGSPKPVNRPYVYLLDDYMRPKSADLPMVVVEVPEVDLMPYELGNRKGHMADAILHVFGRRRGERDDLASFLRDYFGSTFPLYSYTTDGNRDSATFVENAEVDPMILVRENPRTAPQEIRREGGLDLWKQVHIRLRTKV